MASKSEGGKPKIVIIKKKKGGHGGHHGGSWKVAYADFVTAMMALFLLLWLISMVSPERRVQLSEFFKHFSVFQHGQSFMEGSPHAIQQAMQMQAIDPSQVKLDGMNPQDIEKVREKIAVEIEQMLKSKGMFKKEDEGQIKIDIDKNGWRVQIIDTEGRPIFQSGSAELTDLGKEYIKIVATNFYVLANDIVVEGHTDSSPYVEYTGSNWELSAMRAVNARTELQNDGVESDRFARVSGYADTEPFIKDNPGDVRNRRISILFLPLKFEKESHFAKWVDVPDVSKTINPDERNTSPVSPQVAPELTPDLGVSEVPSR